MTQAIHIATMDDISACNAIARQYRRELPFIRRSQFQQSINKQELSVYEWNDRVVGFIRWHRRKDGWSTVYDLAVSGDLVWLGIGTKLMHSIPCPIRLKCTVDNPGANAFYAAVGMVKVATIAGAKRNLNVWEKQAW